MRILQITHSMNPEVGGPAEHMSQLAPVLEDMGHIVEVGCLDSPEDRWIEDAKLKIHALGPGVLKYGYSPKLVVWLKEYSGSFNAVIVRGMWQYSGFGVRKALKGSNTPYFVFPHGMLDPWFCKKYPLKHLKKLIYWHLAEKKVLNGAKAVIFTSEEEKLLAGESFGEYNRNREVVNYGISGVTGDADREKEAFLDKYTHLKGRKIILFMGRIHPKKGCDILLNAFSCCISKYPDAHLVLAGPDQVGWKKELSGLAEEKGITNDITWTGMLKGDLKRGAYKSADAFILPSHQENFGIAVVEALSCSVPVLISNKVNIWREIVSSGAGFAEDDDLEGTTKLLDGWFSLSGEEKDVMRQNARKCFEERFEIHKAAESLLNVLRKYKCGG